MMRPPMQKSALQQNEANRLQHHHQQQPHKHLQQQKQLQQQQHQQQHTAIIARISSDLQQQQQPQQTQETLSTPATATILHKSKLEQRELLVENHLNNACFAQVHHHQQQQQQQHHQQTTTVAPPLPKAKPTTIVRKSLPAYYNDCYQQQLLQQHQQQQHQQQHQPQQRPSSHLVVNSSFNSGRRTDDASDASTVKNRLDLSTLSSPTPPTPQSIASAAGTTVHESLSESSTSLFKTQTPSAATTTELLQNRIPNASATTPVASNTNSFSTNNSQRFSFTSQYSSRSSSSDDSSSLSLSTSTGAACASNHVVVEVGGVGGGGVCGFIVDNSSGSNNLYNNTFDDAAENFIINFPADTSPLPPASASSSSTSTATLLTQSDYYLPLSETEPLLTNIEATVNDKQRSIYLNKNSASLIFTRKDLTATQTTSPAAAATGATPAPTTTYQLQFKLQSKTNNNFTTANENFSTSSSSSSSLASSVVNSANTTTHVRRHQHFTLRSFSEENYKRKPTKHLPATYHQQHRRSLQLNYNNNLVTTTTCGTIANNNHHCCSGSGISGPSLNSNSAVLHKPSVAANHLHHNNHNYQQQQQQLLLQRQHQQQHCSLNSNPCTLTTNNTAAATRKQHAYSWYAPVYSALEEELEQDSRDSSPIHNLANTKKQNIKQYHQNNDINSSSLTATTATDNETEALLESRNNINIQTHLQANPLKRESITKQLHPTKLALAQHNTRNSSGKGNHQAAKSINGGGGGASDISAVEGYSNYELEGPHAGSLGLAGGPQPRRIRFGNFLKSLVGLRPSIPHRNASESSATSANGAEEGGGGGGSGAEGGPMSTPPLQIPSSPEITITRTPSEQNMVVMRDPSGYQEYNAYGSREKLANRSNGERVIQSGGSTSSLNVMQQKLWNIVRREGSAISLHQEKSQSIVHYTGLRKCETVLALTRQTTSPCSPTMGAGGAANCRSRNRLSEGHARLPNMGSGIFSASGVEQIRPLNRLRNSISSMNNTCSRCSSLLSLAASSSRFSLNNAVAAHHHHSTSHQHLRNPSNVSSSNISSTFSRSRGGSMEAGGLQFAAKRNSRTSSAALGSQRNSTSGATSTISSSSRTPSIASPTTTTATTASTIKLTTPPTENSLTVPSLSPPPPTSQHSFLAPPPAHSFLAAATTTSKEGGVYLPIEALSAAPLTVTSLLKVITKKDASNVDHDDENDENDEYDVIDGLYNKNNNNILSSSTSSSNTTTTSPFSATVTTTTFLPFALTNVTPSTSTNAKTSNATTEPAAAAAASATTSESIMATILQHCNTNASTTLNTTTTPTRPFEMFTCKLCLIDVEDSSNSTTLHQCGCQFCTECMKAYVEFEISEGAYEISCPDAQCPEQGVMTLPEIANLTTNNLMKKHHRYRLNREIELDKTRTWCPRAGCETVCLIGSTSSQSDAAPSTSTSSASSAASATIVATTPSGVDAKASSSLCAVQCPSCKDEFCSSCKKTWHPNITCEEHSRRLAADGQDDIGIPFDNDLIKCCPMCAVPIEKDEGCAQMMCKRCKHVFCWYCLASLDDDFLLRHYDKGPCKNKLGHSRASVVWHRAQVIGIFAGFGILLLVASPLLLLAAPCIICCKCRSCSGSKIDEGDGEMDEATALQSLN